MTLDVNPEKVSCRLAGTNTRAHAAWRASALVLGCCRRSRCSVQARKGTFAVRLPNGKVFCSLESMPRPFKPLRELDLEELADKVVEHFSSAECA